MAHMGRQEKNLALPDRDVVVGAAVDDLQHYVALQNAMAMSTFCEIVL